MYFTMYVIAILPDDGQCKRYKWMHSVESVTLVYKFCIQVDYELFYWLYVSGTVFLSHAKKLHMLRNCFLSSFYNEQFNNDADEH
jgi:hypothetical protein